MIRFKVKDLTMQIMVASVYTVASLAIPMLSFGSLQIRFAEILCLLPLFGKKYIFGVTLGCFLTNLSGAIMGVNLLGYADVIFGTLATYLAVLLVYRTRHLTIKEMPVIAMWMPAIVNGIIIGAELAYVLTPSAFIEGFIINGLYIFVAEAIVCFGIGMIIYPKLKESKLFN